MALRPSRSLLGILTSIVVAFARSDAALEGVRPAPPSDGASAIVAEQATASLPKGKKTRATLELTVDCAFSLTTNDSSRNWRSTVRRDLTGAFRGSLAFEEVPVFPSEPSASPTFLSAAGKFSFLSEDRTRTRSTWEGSNYSDEERIVRIEGGNAYEGGSHPAWSVYPANRETYQKLRSFAILELEESDDRTQFSVELHVEGQYREKDTCQSSNPSNRRATDEKNPLAAYRVTISGSFPKGQKRVPLTVENIGDMFPTSIDAGSRKLPTTITVSGYLSLLDEPGRMVVTPGEGASFSGPDEKDRFVPAARDFTVKDAGQSPLTFTVSKSQDWLQLSRTEGTLDPGQTAAVRLSINEPVAKSLEPGDYKDVVAFTNTTGGEGNTTRAVALHVGEEEQTWRVLLSGQETDDVGGKVMLTRLQGKWKNQVVEFGVRFDYNLAVEFTIRKKKGAWVYKNGTITSARVTATHVFDPTIFKVRDEKAVCANCQEVAALAGTSLPGTVSGSTVRFAWPRVIPRATVYSRFRVETTSSDESRKESLKGYGANLFYSECFLDYASLHDLALRDGEAKPFATHRRSSADQYRQKGKLPIQLYHRYVLKKIK